MDGKTILIIDDNQDIRYTLQEICTFAEFNPVVAKDGKEGVQQFLTHNPDLIIVDFHMPVMDGLMTVSTIRQMNKNTPIIILTVDERQEIADKFLDVGANDFALKPIRAPDIISRLKVHLKIAELELEVDENGEKVVVSQTTENKKEEYDLSNILSESSSKGISKRTMYIIADFLIKQETSQTIQQVSKETGISYPTVHRYLNHLLEYKFVTMENNYGTIGRPKNKFNWIK